MAFGTSRIFRSTDSGAPQLTSNVAGSLVAVLRSVLAAGYGGTTESLGWEVIYDTGNIITFRMKGGTRRYIRFDDLNYNSLGHVEVSSFSTMSSQNNGTERIPMVGTYAFIQKQYSTTSLTVPWIIVGDDAGFWLFYKYMGTYHVAYNNRYCAVYFGDYNAWDVRNKWNFILLASSAANPPNATSISEGLKPHGVSTTFKSLVSRGYDFNPGCKYIGIVGGITSTSTYFGKSGFYANSVEPYFLLNGAPIGMPIRIYDNDGSTAKPIILGSLPGVFEPITDTPSATITLANTAQIEYIDSAGELSIYMFLLNNQSVLESTDKILVKVGKGFRNVQ